MSPQRIGSVASFTATILLAGLPISTAYAQLQVADDLLINLEASTYVNNTAWLSTGTIAEPFTPFNTPLKVEVSGATGVFFDGADYFVGPNTIGTLHDFNANYSIETWVYNGNTRPEESLVAWSSRGGPDGTNVSFNYGNDSRWGAMGHWGNPDMGWGPADGTDNSLTPSLGLWHHLVYTYDGLGTQRVYVDGQLTNTETGVTLDPKDALPIQLGAQREGNGVVSTGNTFSGVISKVRVHSGTLTDAQILNNFDFEKAQFPNVTQPQQLVKAPVNRYTFNDLTTANDLTVVPDVIGGKNAPIRGPGATLSSNADGEGVQLPGGNQEQAYIDLPNGIISGKADGGLGYQSASYEAWVTVLGNSHWSRVMDFGASNEVEVTGPGGATNGTNFIFLSANVNSDSNMAIERGGTGSTGSGQRQAPGSTILNTEMHLVLSYDASMQEWRWFQDGKLMEAFSSAGSPLTLNDVNNWLGRSNFGGDGNMNGIFNEFRIYDYALNQKEIAGNFLLGPDVVNVVPEPSSALLLAGAVTLLGARRRRRF